MAPTRLTIARQADEDRLVADIRLGLAGDFVVERKVSGGGKVTEDYSSRRTASSCS